MAFRYKPSNSLEYVPLGSEFVPLVLAAVSAATEGGVGTPSSSSSAFPKGFNHEAAVASSSMCHVRSTAQGGVTDHSSLNLEDSSFCLTRAITRPMIIPCYTSLSLAARDGGVGTPSSSSSAFPKGFNHEAAEACHPHRKSSGHFPPDCNPTISIVSSPDP